MLSERTSEPYIERHRETHLVTIQDFARQQRLESRLEYYLSLTTSKLGGRGQRGRPLDELIVQKWHAYFKAVRHAGPIHFGENIAWEIRLVVEVLHHRKSVREALALQMPPKNLRCTVTGELTQKISGKKSPATIFRKDRHTVQVGLHRISCQSLKGSLSAQGTRR